MSRYILIRRLRGPAFLLLVGVNALLAQAHILSWSKSWPLFLILWGVMLLAERAAMAADGGYPPMPYPGAPYPGAVDPAAGTSIPPYPGQPVAQYQGQPTAIVPAESHDFEKDPDERQL
jgi:hypothetical protein